MAMIAAAGMTITMGTATNMAEAAHLPLAIWLSPAFPIGAFAYSHALEWAVESGDVRDAATLSAWIDDLLRLGSGRNDAVLVAASFHAAHDAAALSEVNELALALAPSRERHLETAAQGTAFVTAMRSSWPCNTLTALDGDVAYPVALGAAARGHNLPLAATLEHFLLAFTANLVSVAVRLGPIGQTDGQRVTAGALPAIQDTARFALNSTLDDLGSATLRADLFSMQHETQYSRLFRS
jgi:urease accessory protein